MHRMRRILATFETNKSLEETRNNIALFYNPLGRWGIEVKSEWSVVEPSISTKINLDLKTAAIGYVLNKDTGTKATRRG